MPKDENKPPAGLPATTQRDQKPTTTQSRARVSQQMRDTITIMAEEGLDLVAAAKRVGFPRASAIRAFAKPAARALFNQAVSDVRSNAAQLAYLRMNHLSKTANSEQVKADANKWVAGVDGIAALKRVEGRMHHTHAFEGFDYDAAMGAKDVSPDTTSDADDE